jgi:REP element-mobilizing transposase RayT
MPPNPFLSNEVFQRVRIRSRGYMPHWEVENGTYFLTYRLKDSLPRQVVERLRQERIAIERAITGGRTPTAVERWEIRRLFGLRVDAELDLGQGKCRLIDLARVVAENLQFFHRKQYDLIAWCVMPNHVHVVATLQARLARVVHSLKSYVAHEAGERLWAREYFDRLIRNERDLAHTVEYVRANPAKAGLINWTWVG